MKITGVLVNMLIQVTPDEYTGYVVYEGTQRVIYIEVLHTIYGMLESALQWYNTFRKIWKNTDSSLVTMIHVWKIK